ncbi:MAG UNVERIFIED_CONTAM: hypothetical protein LVR29_12190 [Microcystis novacekii LVE1205-3]|jgi:aryl-alcohol dehydrogenase-like predicted oxidoreductase
MQKRYLGQTNSRNYSLLVGTWQAGKKMWAGIEDEESIRAIRAAFEAGITTIAYSRNLRGRSLGIDCRLKLWPMCENG